MPKTDKSNSGNSLHNKAKRPYTPPVFSRYGPVKELTTSGSNPMAEKDMGMSQSRRD